jgi:hypothetical protein
MNNLVKINGLANNYASISESFSRCCPWALPLLCLVKVIELFATPHTNREMAKREEMRTTKKNQVDGKRQRFCPGHAVEKPTKT